MGPTPMADKWDCRCLRAVGQICGSAARQHRLGEVGPECLQPGGEEESDSEEILPSDPCAQASC